MVGSAVRAKKRVSAHAIPEKADDGGSGSDSSFGSDSDGSGGGGAAASKKPDFAAQLKTNKARSRRSSAIAANVIAKRPSMDAEDKSVGGFSTKGMAGLTALLAHKSSAPKLRAESFASADDDWDSD